MDSPRQADPAPVTAPDAIISPMSSSLSRTPDLIRIEPTRGWISLGLRELWSYRELGYFLVWRDLKVRYKQTLFGALWAFIQPFMLMLVFSLFLGQIGGISPAGTPYPLFVFAGLVPWTLFSQSLIGASNSLVGAANLIQKVYFPRLLLPMAAVGSYVLDFLIGLAVMALLMLYFGAALSLNVLLIIPFTGLAILTSLAVGIWLAALNVTYRDIRHAVPFVIQVWLFASPVAYSADLVPEQWRALYQLNPIAGVLEGFRWALLGTGEAPPIGSLAISGAVTFVMFVAGIAYFRRVERSFADVI